MKSLWSDFFAPWFTQSACWDTALMWKTEGLMLEAQGKAHEQAVDRHACSVRTCRHLHCNAGPLLPEKRAWQKEKYKQKYVYCASTHNSLMFDASCCLLCFDISINGCFLFFRCLWIYKYVLLMMCSGKKYSHEFYFIHEMFLIWVVFFLNSGCSYLGLKVSGSLVSLSFCLQ